MLTRNCIELSNPYSNELQLSKSIPIIKLGDFIAQEPRKRLEDR